MQNFNVLDTIVTYRTERAAAEGQNEINCLCHWKLLFSGLLFMIGGYAVRGLASFVTDCLRCRGT